MRHAYAEEAINIEDFCRNLTSKGIQEAEEAAKWLQNCQIDKILVSPAFRTIQTANIIQDKLQCPKFEVCSRLYPTDPKIITELVSRQIDEDKNILVIAHNPGIFKTALDFTEYGSSKYDNLIENGMKTAQIVDLDFPKLSEWKNISLKIKNLSR